MIDERSQFKMTRISLSRSRLLHYVDRRSRTAHPVPLDGPPNLVNSKKGAPAGSYISTAAGRTAVRVSSWVTNSRAPLSKLVLLSPLSISETGL